MAKDLIPGDLSIRSIKIGDARKRLTDGDGLYLLLFVKGGAHGWRFDYAFGGRRKTISLGTYPDTGLKLARAKATNAREKVAAGIDPSIERKQQKATALNEYKSKQRAAAGLPAEGSFEAVAREWYAAKKARWALSYGERLIRRLEADVFPWLGSRPIASLNAPEVLEVLRRIEGRGVVETAHRALESVGQVFRYAIQTGRATTNPARDLKDALQQPHVTHFPAVTDPDTLGKLLRSMYGYEGTYVVRAALRLTPMLLLRPGELRHASWVEIDLPSATWTVPAARMKRELHGKLTGPDHVVPLPQQAVAILEDLKKLTGLSPFVFRGERHHDRPMSDAAVNAALRAMGYEKDMVTAHGFRATARTMIVEHLGFDETIVEAQLAHAVKDALGRAYNRAEFLEPRRVMMQAWADYLDKLRSPAGASPATQANIGGG